MDLHITGEDPTIDLDLGIEEVRTGIVIPCSSRNDPEFLTARVKRKSPVFRDHTPAFLQSQFAVHGGFREEKWNLFHGSESLSFPDETHFVAAGAAGNVFLIVACEEGEMAFIAEVQFFLDDRPIAFCRSAFFAEPEDRQNDEPEADVNGIDATV